MLVPQLVFAVTLLSLIGEPLRILMSSRIHLFWKRAQDTYRVSGFPEIKTRLLEKYFANRFNLKKRRNSTLSLEIFEDARAFIP